jgi:hypothetical protein
MQPLYFVLVDNDPNTVDRVILFYYKFDLNFTFYYDICNVKVFTEKHLKMAK